MRVALQAARLSGIYRPPIEWQSPSSWIVNALMDGLPTDSDAPYQLIASFKYEAYVLFSMIVSDAAQSSDNQTRVLEIYNFGNTQDAALFDIKAEFDGFYSLLASRGPLVAFGADVDYHAAHVVHLFGGAARLEIGLGATRMSCGSYMPNCVTLSTSY